MDTVDLDQIARDMRLIRRGIETTNEFMSYISECIADGPTKKKPIDAEAVDVCVYWRGTDAVVNHVVHAAVVWRNNRHPRKIFSYNPGSAGDSEDKKGLFRFRLEIYLYILDIDCDATSDLMICWPADVYVPLVQREIFRWAQRGSGYKCKTGSETEDEAPVFKTQNSLAANPDILARLFKRMIKRTVHVVQMTKSTVRKPSDYIAACEMITVHVSKCNPEEMHGDGRTHRPMTTKRKARAIARPATKRRIDAGRRPTPPNVDATTVSPRLTMDYDSDVYTSTDGEQSD